MTQPPGYYGPPGGYGGDPYGQPSGPPGGGYGGDPYGQPSGPPGYGQPSGPPAGPPGGGYGGDPYGQPSGPPGYGDPYGQPSGPPAGYGQPGFGGPPGGGMPPGAFPPAAPKKGNTGLIIGLVAGVLVLLLCGGGALIYFMSGGGGTPTQAVESFMDAAFNDKDLEAAKAYVCEKEVSSLSSEYDETFGGESASFTASWSNPQEKSNDGTNAEVTLDVSMSVSYQGQTSDVSGTWTFDVVNESGWKVCDIRPSTN